VGVTEEALQRALGSVRFEVNGTRDAFRILGPDTSYHAIDPYLGEALAGFGIGNGSAVVREFREQRQYLDLCFEDVWTGYFVAKRYSGEPLPDELTLVHLDDHADMMSTLLAPTDCGLEDPTSGNRFDPLSPADWRAAISSGSVGIGNFVTALYYASLPVHVRHLNNFRRSDYRCYDVIPGRHSPKPLSCDGFAAVRKRCSPSPQRLGTYMGGRDPERVFNALPLGGVIVHVDLDYFINDFNGNSQPGRVNTGADAVATARNKLDAYFAAIRPYADHIDRWIVATSPGFCSAYHWPWLLREIERGIRGLTAPASGQS
jgi:hypothetical protein